MTRNRLTDELHGIVATLQRQREDVQRDHQAIQDDRSTGELIERLQDLQRRASELIRVTEKDAEEPTPRAQ